MIFCRPGRATIFAWNFGLWDGAKLIGFAENGSHFEYRCSPGKHLFIAEAESDKAIDADLSARKTYYVWVTPRMGFAAANVGLTPVNEESNLMPKLEKALAESKCRELIPELAAEYQEKHRERIQKLQEEFGGDRKESALKLRPQDGR